MERKGRLLLLASMLEREASIAEVLESKDPADLLRIASRMVMTEARADATEEEEQRCVDFSTEPRREGGYVYAFRPSTPEALEAASAAWSDLGDYCQSHNGSPPASSFVDSGNGGKGSIYLIEDEDFDVFSRGMTVRGWFCRESKAFRVTLPTSGSVLEHYFGRGGIPTVNAEAGDDDSNPNR